MKVSSLTTRAGFSLWVCRKVRSIPRINLKICLKQKPRNQESEWSACSPLTVIPGPPPACCRQRQAAPCRRARLVSAVVQCSRSSVAPAPLPTTAWPDRLERSSSRSSPASGGGAAQPQRSSLAPSPPRPASSLPAKPKKHLGTRSANIALSSRLELA